MNDTGFALAPVMSGWTGERFVVHWFKDKEERRGDEVVTIAGVAQDYGLSDIPLRTLLTGGLNARGIVVETISTTDCPRCTP